MSTFSRLVNGYKVFIMELAPNPRIYQLAAHHSNWGVPASNDIDTYMVLINPGAFP